MTEVATPVSCRQRAYIKCPLCSVDMVLYRIVRHVMRVHPARPDVAESLKRQRPYPCPRRDCFSSFLHRWQLNDHVRYQHAGQVPAAPLTLVAPQPPPPPPAGAEPDYDYDAMPLVLDAVDEDYCWGIALDIASWT